MLKTLPGEEKKMNWKCGGKYRGNKNALTCELNSFKAYKEKVDTTKNRIIIYQIESLQKF